MAQGGERDAASSTAGPDLGTALDELKTRGCALLIVGSVPDDVYRQVSARMLGGGETSEASRTDAENAPRRRLVVTGSVGNARDNRIEAVERRTPEWTRIIEFDALARGAAATNGGSPGAGPELPGDGTDDGRGRDPLSIHVEGGPVKLGAAIAKTIEQFDTIARGLEPSELRLAFDCLLPLLAQYDVETAFRFSHILANQVRNVNGMAHFWLPYERTEHPVRVLEPLFDATVELRLDGTQLQQRWHFRDIDLSSDWLPFGR